MVCHTRRHANAIVFYRHLQMGAMDMLYVHINLGAVANQIRGGKLDHVA
jgi:hypothetical protein